MTIGVYCIKHKETGRRYIGKSINIERRVVSHKYHLTSFERSKKTTNRYLYGSVRKHGWGSFLVCILEQFDDVNEELMSLRELYWMDFYNTCDRRYGYNLRRDSTTGMVVHHDTKLLQSLSQSGERNGNFGHRWSDEAKKHMSKVKKKQHSDGVYGSDWRSRIGKASSEFWANNPDIKDQMAAKVSHKKKKYKFRQLDENRILIAEWDSIKDIIAANPTWKWQNIYSVCNGHKKRIYGYKWEKIER